MVHFNTHQSSDFTSPASAPCCYYKSVRLFTGHWLLLPRSCMLLEMTWLWVTHTHTHTHTHSVHTQVLTHTHTHTRDCSMWLVKTSSESREEEDTGAAARWTRDKLSGCFKWTDSLAPLLLSQGGSDWEWVGAGPVCVNSSSSWSGLTAASVKAAPDWLSNERILLLIGLKAFTNFTGH